MPNIHVWRPADGSETSAACLTALSTRETPSIIALTRHDLPQLEASSIEAASMGGYICRDVTEGKSVDLIIVSTRSEVSVCIEATKILEKEYGLNARVVYAHQHFGINGFGASGPANSLFNKFELTPAGLCDRALKTISFYEGAYESLKSPIEVAF
ncbi:hypothetical protein EKO04_003919 [Ascochyta lentis]|uniref:Transketolase C-terminal domain-containing protein n=1 Tax=Ascochyta lentis TaxID=205686 RepID=A0A8H7J644_9PLEO|nr:hypothetical protein EKO04_003919 [Ascochyta lentis]